MVRHVRDRAVSRRGWVLFAAMAVIWGVPYLLIKVAVDEVAPPVVVFARTALASLVLVPLAVHRGVLLPALRRWRPLLAFAAIEMAGPWLLLAHAEQQLPSGLTGLLVATVPLLAAVVAVVHGDRRGLRPIRLLGLAVGFAGVAVVVGVGQESGTIDALSVAEVLAVAVGYSVAPFIADRHLSDIPAVGVIAAALGIVAVAYLPAAVATAPESMPSADAVWALVGLALICTGLAFIVFFALIDEAGPARAMLFTYVNPVVAVGLGVVVLNEKLTVGLIAGAPLVIAGCWLAGHNDPEMEAAAAGAVIDHQPDRPRGDDGHTAESEAEAGAGAEAEAEPAP